MSQAILDLTTNLLGLPISAGILANGLDERRALEHAASRDGRVPPGSGLANQRVGPSSPLRVVNAILSGVHEPGTSHHQLLQAFADDATLGRMHAEMVAREVRAAVGRNS